MHFTLFNMQERRTQVVMTLLTVAASVAIITAGMMVALGIWYSHEATYWHGKYMAERMKRR